MRTIPIKYELKGKEKSIDIETDKDMLAKTFFKNFVQDIFAKTPGKGKPFDLLNLFRPGDIDDLLEGDYGVLVGLYADRRKQLIEDPLNYHIDKDKKLDLIYAGDFFKTRTLGGEIADALWALNNLKEFIYYSRALPLSLHYSCSQGKKGQEHTLEKLLSSKTKIFDIFHLTTPIILKHNLPKPTEQPLLWDYELLEIAKTLVAEANNNYRLSLGCKVPSSKTFNNY